VARTRDIDQWENAPIIPRTIAAMTSQIITDRHDPTARANRGNASIRMTMISRMCIGMALDDAISERRFVHRPGTS
jgi:hypothetical protein